MDETPATVELQISLPSGQAARLEALAQQLQTSRGAVVLQALDILFGITDLLATHTERQDWSQIAEETFRRVWDNEQDASYNDWRNLYSVPAR